MQTCCVPKRRSTGWLVLPMPLSPKGQVVAARWPRSLDARGCPQHYRRELAMPRRRPFPQPKTRLRAPHRPQACLQQADAGSPAAPAHRRAAVATLALTCSPHEQSRPTGKSCRALQKRAAAAPTRLSVRTSSDGSQPASEDPASAAQRCAAPELVPSWAPRAPRLPAATQRPQPRGVATLTHGPW